MQMTVRALVRRHQSVVLNLVFFLCGGLFVCLLSSQCSTVKVYLNQKGDVQQVQHAHRWERNTREAPNYVKYVDADLYDGERSSNLWCGNVHSELFQDSSVNRTDYLLSLVAKDTNPLVKPFLNLHNPNAKPKLHVILTFPIYRKECGLLLRKRNAEYLQSLRTYLNNAYVKRVYFLYDDPILVEFITLHVGNNTNIMSFHQIKNSMIAGELHEFAFRNLQNELVMVVNGDILMGNGFEYVDKSLIQREHILYALTRHEFVCHYQYNSCTNNFQSAYDAYIFVPRGTPTYKWKRYMNHTVDSWGTDSMIVYSYSQLLNYKVLNPCKIINIFHNHCSKVRILEGERPKHTVTHPGAQLKIYPSWSLN